MSSSIYSTTLVYPALMHGKMLQKKTQRNSQGQTTNSNPVYQHPLKNDQVCFSGNTPSKSSDERARDAERAFQKVQNHPKASQEDKEFFRMMSDEQHTTSGKAKKYGAYTGMAAAATTSVKGAALTAAHPIAGPALATSSPFVGKTVADHAANLLHDKVLDWNNHPGLDPVSAKIEVVSKLLDGKTSSSDGSAYEFDSYGTCYEVKGLSKSREKEIQKEYQQRLQEYIKNGPSWSNDWARDNLRKEVEKYIVKS